jgi:serine/threonine protein phosphatase PrpC
MMSSDAATTLRCAGVSDTGLRRQNNEDRIHYDLDRGLFIVVDGVGGQAAGERAAEIALTAVRAGVERDNRPPDVTLRDAIIAANNDIWREARSGPEFAGMGCVLTAAIVADGVATIGHVGDTRLYKFRNGAAVKITHDHSPVGEQEESGQLSEESAMRHPMRNQVYRALGASERPRADAEFVDIHQVPFEDDSALLICSDGLTDLVPLGEITHVVDLHGGDPRSVVSHLIEAAKREGGKDNVSAIFVAGKAFAPAAPVEPDTAITEKISLSRPAAASPIAVRDEGPPPSSRPGRLARTAIAFVCGALAGALGAGAYLLRGVATDRPPAPQLVTTQPRTFVVGAGTGAASATINGALMQAEAGDTIAVEPGEYREHVVLRKGVRLTSAAPRGAVILPVQGEVEAAVIIDVPQAAAVVGFEIRGSAEAPLPVGILIRRGDAEIADVAISGTRDAAIDISNAGASTVRGADLRVDRGTAIRVRAGAAPRITHNRVARVRTASGVTSAVEIQGGGRPSLVGNVISGFGASPVSGLADGERERLAQQNLLMPDAREAAPADARKTKPGGGS